MTYVPNVHKVSPMEYCRHREPELDFFPSLKRKLLYQRTFPVARVSIRES